MAGMINGAEAIVDRIVKRLRDLVWCAQKQKLVLDGRVAERCAEGKGYQTKAIRDQFAILRETRAGILELAHILFVMGFDSKVPADVRAWLVPIKMPRK